MVSGNDDPDHLSAVPTLVMGMAPLHKPATQVGQNATRALKSVQERGHPANYLAGDRAYTQAKAEDFQLPARALGYNPVLDYKINQLGHQGSHAGMNLVDGAWYCPGMPEQSVIERHHRLPERRHRRDHPSGPDRGTEGPPDPHQGPTRCRWSCQDALPRRLPGTGGPL